MAIFKRSAIALVLIWLAWEFYMFHTLATMGG